eukprot:COSAG02_NODE_104_length_36421_cov_132.465420_25_plen_77_part_01
MVSHAVRRYRLDTVWITAAIAAVMTELVQNGATSPPSQLYGSDALFPSHLLSLLHSNQADLAPYSTARYAHSSLCAR